MSDDRQYVMNFGTPEPGKFTCTRCGGSGLWRNGKANQYGNEKCWTCRGKGFTKNDPNKLARRRLRQREVREKQKDLSRSQNESYPGVLTWVKENSHWNSFARSLLEQHNRGLEWSDKQVGAVSVTKENTPRQNNC